MAQHNRSTLSKERTIPIILQYLKENGFEETFEVLQTEAAMRWEKCEPHKPARLMEALTVWDELQSRSDAKLQEVSPDQRADEQALTALPQSLLPAGTAAASVTAAAEKSESFDALHKMPLIAVRYAPNPTGASPQLVASGSSDKTVKVWDSETGAVTATVDAGGPVLALDFNPTRPTLLVVGCMNNTHKIVDYKQNPARTLTREALSSWSSGLLLTAVVLWVCAVLQEFKDHSKYVIACKWSADGTRFVTASHDRTVAVYAYEHAHTHARAQN
jgi:hypothetical protein